MALNAAAAEQLFDYDVVDSAQSKIGTVDNIWEDSSTGEPAFIGAKTGWLTSRTYVIPVAGAKVDTAGRAVRLPYTTDQIKNAPHLSSDSDMTPEDENTIYQYYGVQGAGGTGIDTAVNRAGVGTAVAGTAAVGTAAALAGREVDQRVGRTGQEEVAVPLAEERINVEKRMVEAGRVSLRKIVRTEHVSVPVELRREHVEVERVAATGGTVAGDAFTEKEISVPVMREEAVATKTAVVTGVARIHKTAETEARTVEGEIRKEDVEIDKTGTEFTAERDAAELDRTAKR